MLLPILLLATSTSARPLQPSTTSAREAPAPEVEWLSGRLADALARARIDDQLVFVYVWTNSSQQCQRTWSEAITSPEGQAVLESFVCFSAPLGTEESTALVAEYNVTTLPTMLILTPFGECEDALLGYHSASLLASDLDRIRAGIDTVSSRRKLAEAAPDDLALRFSLAAKLDHVGAKVESQKLYDSIIADDPEGRSVVSARLQLWRVMNAIADAAADPSNTASYQLEPIYAHMAKVGPDEVVVEGWDWIAQIEGQRGERAKALEAMRSAWPHMSSDNQTLDWGLRTADYIWTNRGELAPADKAFALEIAERCAELDEARIQAGGTEERELVTLDVLANAYTMNDRAEEALRTIELSIERNGTTPERQQMLERCRESKP